MTAIFAAAAVGMLITLLGTPLLIRFLHRRQYGQFIREDGPQGHFTKRGTPTMGGLVIILATVLGYGAANLIELRTPRASGILLLFLIVGLGLIGFLDDFEKISKERSLGLRAWQKMLGQAFIGITFAVVALCFADRNGLTPASTRVSFARDTNLDLAFAGAGVGLVLFVLWANFLITAWSNAVNLTDGLDGLAAFPVVLVAAGLACGAAIPRVLDALAAACARESLAWTAHALRLGVSWADAWEETPKWSIPLRDALESSWTSGNAPETMLARSASWERRARLADAKTRAEELSVRLVGPLGACFLPAFLALGIAPLLATLTGGLDI